MKNYHKIIGKPFGNSIEFNCSFSRWLIGFGWVCYNRNKHIHFNLGPLVIVINII